MQVLFCVNGKTKFFPRITLERLRIPKNVAICTTYEYTLVKYLGQIRKPQYLLFWL